MIAWLAHLFFVVVLGTAAAPAHAVRNLARAPDPFIVIGVSHVEGSM